MAVEEVHDDGTPTCLTFEHVPSEIGAEEAEEIGVEHLLRDIRDSTAGTLAQRITQQLSAMKGLHRRLTETKAYLERVVGGELPVNNEIMYQLQDMFNLLPNLNVTELVRSFSIKTNDQMLVVYLASLIRAVIALHNLIANKISNRDAERSLDAGGDEATGSGEAAKDSADEDAAAKDASSSSKK